MLRDDLGRRGAPGLDEAPVRAEDLDGVGLPGEVLGLAVDDDLHEDAGRAGVGPDDGDEAELVVQGEDVARLARDDVAGAVGRGGGDGRRGGHDFLLGSVSFWLI